MLLPARWTPLKPHAIQQQYLRCNRRFIGVDAGRGSGKTELTKRRLVMRLAMPVSGCSTPMYFYALPTERQARRVAWEDLVRLVPKEWLLPGTSGINRSDLVIRTVFNSSLWVCGMDRPERIEGNQYAGGVCDEACDYKSGAVDRSVIPALGQYLGFLWRVGVPKRAGPSAWEFREFCERARPGESSDEASFTWPASDIMPPEAIEHAMRTLDPLDYTEQFNAQWQTAGGGIFYAFDEKENVRRCTYDPNKELVIGSDFNVDPMCWAIGHADEESPTIEWHDEIWERNCHTPEALEKLWGRYHDHRGGVVFIGDASGRQRHTSASQSDYDLIWNHSGFRKIGRQVHYPPSNPPIADRFAACNAMICNAAGQRRMFVDPQCVNLIKDLRMRYYKPGTTDPADSAMIGHMTDAMGYVVQHMFPLSSAIETICRGRYGIVASEG